jgi:REP element-mobilizing transposase RayT
MKIFLDDVDYRKFLYMLTDALDVWDVDCLDVCVMPNHYHLALLDRQAALSRMMHQLDGEYAIWWNARHGRVGHVFQGRYKDQIVQREGYVPNLLRYIAKNPVRARLVKSPELWPWSAYQYTAGFAPNPGFVRSDLVLALFGDADVQELRQRYIEHVLVEIPDDNESYLRFRSRQRILGDRAFKLQVQRRLRAEPETATGVAPAVYLGFP